ncbi:hypothetical protein AWW72_17995 [Acinetobacter sp. NRRL B-65365]|uniref:hypothetical protein n=1 Tax=Acinetobacter sp. NRRL B-65365 TaxID=1785092 RepID=UPI0007A0C85D|nr:hypothetical protein [Acinetobacter sp. NRRL B-65365]KYQ82498.1 hypothetical protein AWW72_17995 [Acinetobacter sp. NRRL B-65365]
MTNLNQQLYLRQKFEELPEFKHLLEMCEWDAAGLYVNTSGSNEFEHYADGCNGGLTAFICQQHKIEELKSQLEKYQNPDLSADSNALINNFADQMKVKLVKAQEKYGFNDDWKSSDWEAKCRGELYRHLNKGDPIDVANYCAFMLFHKWSTSFLDSAYALLPKEPTEVMMLKALNAIKSEIGKDHIDVKIVHTWREMYLAFNGEIKPHANHGISLTCEALLEAFQYGAPDYNFDDEELTEDIKNQLSTEMTILWWENGHSGTGFYAYYTEYPEEGSIKLGGDDEH